MKNPSYPPKALDRTTDQAFLSSKHLRFGWWSLAIFLSLGMVLESLHGLKIGWYLNVSNETRRLMLTLAHAHGTLLALVNVVFSLTLPAIPLWAAKHRRLASDCLLTASVLIPAGFLIGGINIHGGDPGLGIFLLPPGALLLLIAVVMTATALRTRPGASSQGAPKR